MRAFRLDEPHALEARDAVVDVDDQLVVREIQRELAGQLVLARAFGATRAGRAPDAPEQLGVGRQVESQPRLGAARRDVDGGVRQQRLDLQVHVEVDLAQRAPDLGRVEQRPQPLVLLGGEHDRRAVAPLGQAGQRTWLADERLTLEPTEVGRVRRALGRCHGEARPPAQVVQPVHRRQHELPRQLAAARLRRGQHRGLVEQRPRVDQLARRLEVHDHRRRRQVVEQRGPRRVEIGRVELDSGEGRALAQARQVVIPLRAHVAAQALQGDGAMNALHGRPTAVRTDQQLAPGADHGFFDRHHGALVFRVEQAQRLDRVARPLGPHRRIRGGGKHVEDAAA